MQVKRLMSSIFPSTNDVYGFQLDKPSIESLNCYEQYAKMAREACLLPTATSLIGPKQHYEILTSSLSSSSSYEM